MTPSRGMSMRLRPLVFALACMLASAACSESTATDGDLPTVLIANATCEAGHCANLEIRAFVVAFHVPQPQTGFMSLGEMPPGQTCLAFPATWALRLTGPDSTGALDTTSLTWVPDDPEGVYLVAIDTSSYGHLGERADPTEPALPYDGFGTGTLGETTDFVPGTSRGWKVTFPGGPVRDIEPVKAAACTIPA